MRLILTFVGGIIAGVLLFLLMQQMVENESPGLIVHPRIVISLPEPVMPEPQPSITKPDDAPQPPKHNSKPAGPTELPVDPTIIEIDPGSDTPTINPGEPADIDITIPGPGEYRPSGQAICSVMIAPVYPRPAARAGTEGRVELLFTIQTDGSVADISVVSAQPRGVFEQAAEHAVAKWHCSPAVVDGKPVARQARQTLLFQLDEK